jgi:hypothetical protein
MIYCGPVFLCLVGVGLGLDQKWDAAEDGCGEVIEHGFTQMARI